MKKRILPFLLTVAIIVADRISKNWVVATIPVNTIYRIIGNDLVWICHFRNTGIAFSVGDSLSGAFRFIAFTIIPLLAMIFMSYLIIRKKSGLTTAQRWFMAGVVGGGCGTLIDRLLYFDEGVVDFISVKFFGIFGLDRWPTFNISDSCVVVFVILLAISILAGDVRRKKR